MNTYNVQPGDTLQSIAVKFFGDESMAGYLASINSIAAVSGWAGGFTYLITPGQELNVGVAEVEAKKINPWPWAIGAGLLTAIVFRKKIRTLFKKSHEK